MFDNANSVSPTQSWRNWYEQRQEYVFNLLSRIDELIEQLSFSVEFMQLDDEYFTRNESDNYKRSRAEVAKFKTHTLDLLENLQQLRSENFSDVPAAFESLLPQYELDVGQQMSELSRHGFPDLCEQSDLFSQKCQNTHEKMAAVINKVMRIFTHTASYRKQDFTSEVLTRLHKFQLICDDLALMAKPFDALENGALRAKRLKAMLDSLVLSDSQESVVNGQNQLRVIASCLSRDDLMCDVDRQVISQRLHLKVSESSCMGYITKCEFYSLLMLLLSCELDDEVRDAVQLTLRSKFRSGDMPDTTKLEYYICFIEMLDIHSDHIEQKQNLLTHFLGEIGFDVDRLQIESGKVDQVDYTCDSSVSTQPSGLRLRGSLKADPAVLYSFDNEMGSNMAADGSGSVLSSDLRLSAIDEDRVVEDCSVYSETMISIHYRQFKLLEQMYKIRLESYVCSQSSLDDYALMLTKQYDRLESQDLTSISYPLKLCFWKLKVHTLANLLSVQSRCYRSKPCMFIFFSSPVQWFSFHDIDQQKKRFTEAIWSEPSITLEEISKIYGVLESWLDDALVQDMTPFFKEMVDKFWDDDQLDSESIHEAFKNTKRGLSNVIPDVDASGQSAFVPSA